MVDTCPSERDQDLRKLIVLAFRGPVFTFKNWFGGSQVSGIPITEDPVPTMDYVDTEHIW